MAVHNTLTGSELHENKGAAAATKNFALIADGAGSSAFLALLGTNTVVVRQLSDLPTPAAGKIILAANTTYMIGASINLGTDFLDFGAGSSIITDAPLKSIITYTGTNPMLQGVDVSSHISGVTLDAPNANLMDWSETATGGTKLLLLDGVLVLNCKTVATFDKMGTTVFEGMTVISCTDGVVITGAVHVGLRMVSISFSSTDVGFVGLDVTGATLKTLNLDGMILNGGAGSIGIKGDAASANIAANFIANVNNVQFAGVTTPLSGITIDDIRWNFQGNGIVPDTMPDALLSFSNNATVTTLSVGVPTLIAGTFTLDRASQFTTTTAGRATYNGERDLVTPIDVSV